MSLLTIAQKVASRCNLPTPVSVIGNTDANVQMILSAIQDIGDELSERWAWASLKLIQPVTFTGDGTTASFPLPAGWSSLNPSDTFVSSAYPTLDLPGPVNEETLLRMKILPVTVQPSVWREARGMIEFFPVLAVNEVVSYVFQQNTWIVNSAGVPYPNSSAQFDQPVFQADTDLTLIKERLIMLGAIQLVKRRRGFDYAEELADYELAFARISGAENTEREIYMSRFPFAALDFDTFFPGTITRD
jgi:hypothetical protein